MQTIPLHSFSAVLKMPVPAPPFNFFILMLQAAAVYIRDKFGTPAPAGAPRQPYCSFLARAIERDLVWFGTLTTPIPLVVVQKLADFPRQFEALEPAGDYDNAVVITLPNLSDPDQEILEAIRLILSMKYCLPRGLIIGAFWLGLENSETNEQWTLPMLVVRWMVPQDKGLISRLPNENERRQAEAKRVSLYEDSP